jgi:hypothetical protein
MEVTVGGQVPLPDLHPHRRRAVGQVDQVYPEQAGEAGCAELLQGSRELGSVVRERRDLWHEPGTLPAVPIE